jgi:hypothetical protein
MCVRGCVRACLHVCVRGALLECVAANPCLCFGIFLGIFALLSV